MLTALINRPIASLILAVAIFMAVSISFLPKGYCFTCFFSYEQISGMNKICYYSCLTGTVAITISSMQLCPLSINR